jgi:hypothetical protein
MIIVHRPDVRPATLFKSKVAVGIKAAVWTGVVEAIVSVRNLTGEGCMALIGVIGYNYFKRLPSLGSQAYQGAL